MPKIEKSGNNLFSLVSRVISEEMHWSVITVEWDDGVMILLFGVIFWIVFESIVKHVRQINILHPVLSLKFTKN